MRGNEIDKDGSCYLEPEQWGKLQYVSLMKCPIT